MKKIIKRKTKQKALPKSRISKSRILKSRISKSRIPKPRIPKPRINNSPTKSVKDLKKRLFIKTIGTLGVSAFLFSLFSKKSQALVFGSAPATSVVGSKDAANARINPAKEEDNFPVGSTSDGSIALVSANTWYAVPSSAPTVDYTLIVSLENADGVVRFSFDNGGTPSATNGNIAPNHLAVKIGAGKTLYFGSSTAGDDINFTVIQKE